MLRYRIEDGGIRIHVTLAGDSARLNLNQIAGLFQGDKAVISRHIKNIFDEDELDPSRTAAELVSVQTEGARSVAREIGFYRLEVIVPVGYRVKSARGTRFCPAFRLVSTNSLLRGGGSPEMWQVRSAISGHKLTYRY